MPCVGRERVELLTIRISPEAMRDLLRDAVLKWAGASGEMRLLKEPPDEMTVHWDEDHSALVQIKIKLGDDFE